MSNRRRLARERLEIYLVQLILAYRLLILSGGVLILIYAIAIMFTNAFVGLVSLCVAIFLLLVGNSYHAALYTARLAAWIGTLGKHDE